MARVQKVSDQVHMSVFDALAKEHVPIDEHEPEMKQDKQKKSAFDRSFEEISESPKLSHNNIDELDIVRRGSSVRSARCGNIGNEGASENGYGVANKNSVLDPHLLDRIAESQSNKERTDIEKKSTNDARAKKQAEYRSNHAPKIGEDEEEYFSHKGASVVSNPQSENTSSWASKGSISIFDNEMFERATPTDGEAMEKKQSKKDNSWQQIKHAQSIQDKEKELFDNLASHNSESSYKSTQKEATDRLFEIFKIKKGK